MHAILPLSLLFITLLALSPKRRASGTIDLFDEAGARSGIPARLLRVIAKRESGNDPMATPNARSSQAARGLMQITGIVRQDYNRRHGTDITPDDLWDPRVNVAIGADLLRTIVDAYRATGLVELQPDWTSRRWVDLLSLGYGAGYSARSGVIYAARALHQQKREISVESIERWGPEIPGVYAELYRPAKVRWCKDTAGLFFGIKPS